jgi:anti-sigma factor RsiW
MKPCRESALDALLAGELAPEDAARVQAHADGCAACRHALAWMRLERGWMAQRARRMPARPALRFAALEARLEQKAASRVLPHPGTWSHWGKMMMGAAAAVAFVGFSMAQVAPVAPGNEAFRGEVFATAVTEACEDPSRDAVAALEARVGACLVATPLLPLR